MGRPSKATAEVVEQVETALARGATIPMAAAHAGVSPRTVKSWLASGVIARRRLRSVLHPEADPVREGTFTDERIEEAMVSSILRAARIDWRAARFILRSRWPERCGRGRKRTATPQLLAQSRSHSAGAETAA